MEKEYKVDDLILSVLNLPDPCPIGIKITEHYVLLYVGPRDWIWDKETGENIGAGTRV